MQFFCFQFFGDFFEYHNLIEIFKNRIQLL